MYRVGGFGLFACAALVASAAAAGERQTSLDVGTPQGSFVQSQAGPRLSSVQVEVRNSGEAPAKNVSVRVTMPSGQRLPLRGPRTLPPRQSAVYSAASHKIVEGSPEISAEAECNNCGSTEPYFP